MQYNEEKTTEKGESTMYLSRRASRSSSSPTATPALAGCLTTGGRGIEVEDVGMLISCEGLSDTK